MTAILNGVRVVEVAEHTFVPAASALLADWGAEVIKIEHVTRGDAMRGLASTGVAIMTPTCTCCSSTRTAARRASGSTSARPTGSTCCTSSSPPPTSSSPTSSRACARSCKIGVDEIRAHNPKIIYVRGTGQGDRGPEADKGSLRLAGVLVTRRRRASAPSARSTT